MIVTGPAALATLVRRSRIIAVSFTAFSAAVYFWAALREWDVPDGTGRRIAYLGLLGLPFALAVVHQVLFRQLRWPSRQSPAAFLLGSHQGRPAFLGAKPQAPHGAYLILFGLLVGSRSGNLVTTEQDRSVQFLGLAVAVFLGARMAGLMFRRPYLTIGTDGVWLGSIRPRLIGWDSIRPAGPKAPQRTARTLQLPVEPVEPVEPATLDASTSGVSSQTWNRLRGRGLDYDVNVNALLATDPSLVRAPEPASLGPAWTPPAWTPLDLRAVAIDHDLVAHAIRYYRGNPAARASIGAEAGHIQLLTATGKT